MAYLKIECSVARNKKFVKAGPAASWLWVCGLAYCQEGLTDGFIPSEAIDYLGVPKAARLATVLVLAGLWDACDGGGWRIHDYLEHNRSASEVADIKERRGAGGKQGGRPRKNLTETFKVSPSQTFPVAVVDVAVVAAVDLSDGSLRETDPPMDVWLFNLQSAYPQHRVTRNARTQHAFVDAMNGHREGPFVARGVLMANLAANIASHEWHVKGMVPSLEKYIVDGLWLNVHPADPPAAEQVSPRTMRMLGAL